MACVIYGYCRFDDEVGTMALPIAPKLFGCYVCDLSAACGCGSLLRTPDMEELPAPMGADEY